jgi:hypothetical protein
MRGEQPHERAVARSEQRRTGSADRENADALAGFHDGNGIERTQADGPEHGCEFRAHRGRMFIADRQAGAQRFGIGNDFFGNGDAGDVTAQPDVRGHRPDGILTARRVGDLGVGEPEQTAQRGRLDLVDGRAFAHGEPARS